MYVSIENQRKLDMQRHCLWKSHITILTPKRTQTSDTHFIIKSSDIKKQASITEVKVTEFLAEHNLPPAACPVSKSIFRDLIIAKEHYYG